MVAACGGYGVVKVAEGFDPVGAMAVEHEIAEAPHGERLRRQSVQRNRPSHRSRQVIGIHQIGAGADHQLRRPGRAEVEGSEVMHAA